MKSRSIQQLEFILYSTFASKSYGQTGNDFLNPTTNSLEALELQRELHGRLQGEITVGRKITTEKLQGDG